jgi:general secretion pathway protein F
MPNFRYRALSQTGEVVSGVISAPTATEVARRIDYLRLVPIGTIREERASAISQFGISLGRHSRPEDVTVFTRDLALLLKAKARLDYALELLASDTDTGRIRETVMKIRSSVLSGESFADALAHYPAMFSPMYVALVRVGEASGSLDRILEMLANERSRAEALRRKLSESLRYPLFVLFGSACVLIFFLVFVLPQFSAVLRDFGANIDPVAGMFIGLSEMVTTHKEVILTAWLTVLIAFLVLARQANARAATVSYLARLPLIRTFFASYRTALFCRNLSVLLSAAVPPTVALRILSSIMATIEKAAIWSNIVEQVRHGRKMSDVLAHGAVLPEIAVRMLRLGEETGELPMLAGRVADFYEAKLQRSMDGLVALVGPIAIILVSVIVGGLIVSVMTSLMSVSQLVS